MHYPFLTDQFRFSIPKKNIFKNIHNFFYFLIYNLDVSEDNLEKEEELRETLLELEDVAKVKL